MASQHKDPTVDDLKNITVGDKPVTVYIAKEMPGCTEDAPVNRELQETIKQHKMSIGKHTVLDYAGDTRKVSKRMVHLSDRQIRKEYGLMEKPFKTQVENILWLIINQGPISSAEMCAELGKKQSALSSIISRVYQALGPDGKGWISRDIENAVTPGIYSATTEFSPEAGKRIVNAFMGADKARRKQATTNDDNALTAAQKTSEYLAVGSKVKQAVSKAVSEALGIEVKITGEIKITFGFAKAK